MGYVNKRPVDIVKIQKLINQIYRSNINRHKYPVIVLNLQLLTNKFDINIDPNKRSVFIQNEGTLFEKLRDFFIKLYEPNNMSFTVKSLDSFITINENTNNKKRKLSERSNDNESVYEMNIDEDDSSDYEQNEDMDLNVNNSKNKKQKQSLSQYFEPENESNQIIETKQDSKSNKQSNEHSKNLQNDNMDLDVNNHRNCQKIEIAAHPSPTKQHQFKTVVSRKNIQQKKKQNPISIKKEIKINQPSDDDSDYEISESPSCHEEDIEIIEEIEEEKNESDDFSEYEDIDLMNTNNQISEYEQEQTSLALNKNSFCSAFNSLIELRQTIKNT